MTSGPIPPYPLIDTSEAEKAAAAELVEAWPDLAADPVYVDQLGVIAVRAAAPSVLTSAYWRLREYAAAYRGTKQFRRTRELWEADRTDHLAYERHVIHEFYAKGIEAAAREIAELLGVPEHEIEGGDGCE